MRTNVEKVVALRKSGATYKEIAKKIGLAKSSISNICNKYVKNNASYIKRSCSNLEKMSAAADLHYKKQRVKAENKWKNRLESVDPIYIAYILGLYAGEGRKDSTEFRMANSNKTIISHFMHFLKGIGANFSLSLKLHSSQDKEECIDFWNMTFDHIYQRDNRKQRKSKSNKYRLYYGTVTVRVKEPLGLKEALLKKGNSMLSSWKDLEF